MTRNFLTFKEFKVFKAYCKCCWNVLWSQQGGLCGACGKQTAERQGMPHCAAGRPGEWPSEGDWEARRSWFQNNVQLAVLMRER